MGGNMEPQEIREEVKEELEKEEKKESWFGYLALTTVILAVCATLSSFKVEHYSVESVLNQNLASDQWAFYQSKSIKGYLYDLQKEKLELDLKTIEKTAPGTITEQFADKIGAYGKSVKKYEQEKNEIMQVAKNYEKKRDHAQEEREIFGMAVVFLQMGILLCSIAALMRKKILWLLGIVVGAVGVIYFANGFIHFLG
jgi:hypothetical protein